MQTDTPRGIQRLELILLLAKSNNAASDTSTSVSSGLAQFVTANAEIVRIGVNDQRASNNIQIALKC